MADKLKRFRLLVVKEIYDTERDYTKNLEFTVTYLLEKARQKGQHDNSFSEKIIQTLFCNIEEILALHQQLMADLDSCMGAGASYDTTIAQCYLKHKERFSVYKRYGENNEHSQKLLYELEEQPAFKAFFVGCMLLGGKGDRSIDSYLFKPIQRVCKYPLLFRELEKYTPQGHPDRHSTTDTLTMMRDICSVINEAKRRVEKLEAIADWQATVEGWEGSNVVDTCNELIKEGPLIKISAGNTQERMFFLFDNLLVYCKKALLSRSKSLLFRGRVPVESLDIENIEDGTADYHTNGISVTNSWKVHNVSKNKWFVLIARTAEEKQQWMEAIRREKEKRKRLATGIARATRSLVLNKGEKLYHLAKREGQLIRDHKPRLRTYTKCFSGEELVTWLLQRREVDKVEEAVFLGQALLENGLIHHVNDKHQFKMSELLYRFRYDDGTFRVKYEGSDLLARGLRIYCRLHGLFDPLIKEQRIGLRTMKCVIHAQRLLDWLQTEGDISTREEGVTLGQDLYATGILRHATDDKNFKDIDTCYRFTADDAHERAKEKDRRPTAITRMEFASSQVLSCLTITVPFLGDKRGYGVQLSDSTPLTVKFASPEAQLCGVCAGQRVVAVNGHFAWQGTPSSELLEALSPLQEKLAPPIHLTVVKNSSEYCTLVPPAAGLGFNIKGSAPVVIHSIDKGSAAAEAGLLPGCCIFRVGEEDVMRASHDSVVAAVRGALSQTSQQEGGASVTLKVGFPSLEQVAIFKYDNNEDIPINVVERTLESPYTFTLPAKLLKLYASEAEQICTHISKSSVKETKMMDYVTELRALATSYKRASTILSSPRWPSYKPHGIPHSAAMEACPTSLHTSTLDVVAGCPPFPSPTHTSQDDDACSPPPSSPPPSSPPPPSPPPPLPKTYTTYSITTMAAPSIMNKSFSKVEWEGLKDANTRRELCHELMSRLNEIHKDHEVISDMVLAMKNTSHPAVSHTDFNDSLSVTPHLNDDLTPSSSPVLARHNRRQRLVSVSNPETVIKLMVDGLVRKVYSLVEFVGDQLLLSVVEETAPFIPKPAHDTISECKQKLKVLCEDVKLCVKRLGEPLVKAVKVLIEAAKTYVQDLTLHVLVSLALCDSIDLVQSTDKLFMQCLTAVVTAFAHHLMAAAGGQLNPAVECEIEDSEANSQQWLRLVAQRGALVHLQSTMMVQQMSELSTLWDLFHTAQQLRNVRLHVAADIGAKLPLNTQIPQVSVEGDRSELHVTFLLPPVVFSTLPEPMHSTMGIRLHPVLFNKSMMDLEEGSDAYSQERELNNASLFQLKDYYRSLRAFRLDRSQLPEDNEARLLAIHQISQPLNAMDMLVQQLEVAIREPMRPGVGLLTIAAELTTRIGALRINLCNSGVFRSGLATSLEHVMVLSRCHGLPIRNFRSALNTLRRKGSFSYIARKNKADITIALPKQPPKLYQLPPDA